MYYILRNELIRDYYMLCNSLIVFFQVTKHEIAFLLFLKMWLPAILSSFLGYLSCITGYSLYCFLRICKEHTPSETNGKWLQKLRAKFNAYLDECEDRMQDRVKQMNDQHRGKRTEGTCIGIAIPSIFLRKRRLKTWLEKMTRNW